MADNTLELIRLRNNFYRDNYRRAMVLVMILAFVLIFTTISIVYMVFNRPQPKYFAATESGRILQLVPLNRPTMTSKALLSWASEVATASYTYSFVNYRQKIQELQPYFTPNGWSQFMTALKSSDNLSAIDQRKLIVSAVVSGTPVIVHQGELAGRYAWKVQLPMLVTFQSASDRFQTTYTVTMTIIRVSTLQTESGIGVEQFIVG
ncbi:MAG: type IVB secretion system apparatus protein IcmL/DotI [Gammaproteobacteria bacterium]